MRIYIEGEGYAEVPADATPDEIASLMPSDGTDVASRRAAGAGGFLRLPGMDTGIKMSPKVSEFMAGMGRRFAEIGTLGTHEVDPEAAAPLDDSGYATAGGVVADIGAIAAGGTALKGAQGLGAAGRGVAAAGRALSAPKTLAQATIGGGAYGAATSHDRAAGAIGGAVGGAVGHGIVKTVAGLAAPPVTDAAKKLSARGVKLTPGEMFGGMVQSVEDKATSIPFVGDFIRSAKTRSLTDFNRSVINESLAKVGAKLDDSIPIGREAIAAADDLISKQYDAILPGMDVTLDIPFVRDMAKLQAMMAQLPKKERRYFDNVVQGEIARKFGNPNGMVLGKTFKETDSFLRQEYKGLLKSQDHYQQKLGQAVREAHKALIEMGKRQHPDKAAALQAADLAYAMMGRVKDAASSLGAKDGVFTPAQLVNAVKKASGKNRFAKGQGFGQEFAEAAKEALPSSVPDSGTTGRALLSAGALGGAAALGPGKLATLAGVAGLYSRPVVDGLQYLALKRPDVAVKAGKALKSLAPYAGVLGIAAGTNGVSVPQ